MGFSGLLWRFVAPVKKSCGLHVRDLSAVGVQGGGGGDLRQREVERCSKRGWWRV